MLLADFFVHPPIILKLTTNTLQGRRIKLTEEGMKKQDENMQSMGRCQLVIPNEIMFAHFHHILSQAGQATAGARPENFKKQEKEEKED